MPVSTSTSIRQQSSILRVFSTSPGATMFFAMGSYLLRLAFIDNVDIVIARLAVKLE